MPAAIYGTRAVFNAAAEALFRLHPSARQACIEGLDETKRARGARELSVGGRPMVFFPMFDDDDEVEAAVGIAGTLHDVPAFVHLIKKDLPHFREILHQTPNVVFTARPTGEIDYLSRRWYEIVESDSRMRPEDSLKKAMRNTSARDFFRTWHASVLRGQAFHFQVALQTRSGRRTFDVAARPVRLPRGPIVKWIATLTDIEDRVLARESLIRLKNRFQLLAEATTAVASSRTLIEVAERLTSLSGSSKGERWFIELRYPASDVIVRRNLSDATRHFITDMFLREDSSALGDPDRIGEVSCYIASPIAGEAETLGFIGYARPLDETATEEENTLIEELADRAAIGVERILSYMREQELARMLQRSMLPLALPHSPGVRLDVAYEAAQREALVGGDWYDAFELPDGRIVVSIGDVAGHGFDAAVVMNQVRHAMQTAAMTNADPAHVLAAANRLVNAQSQPMVTAFVGILDPLTLSIQCASAGHPPAIVVSEDGSVRAVECEGIPLGVSDELFVKTVVEELPAGGALVLYTDGVVEDLRDLPAGERALAEALSRWATRGFTARAADLQAGLRVGTHQDDAATFVLRFPHVDDFEVRLAATPYNAQRMRLAARRFVSGSPFEPERAFNAVLSVGEAVNNAVEHAYGDGGGAVTLVLKRETQRLIIDVHDEGAWREPATFDRMHGLGIVERLADNLEIHHGEYGTSVHIEIAYRAPHAAVAAQAV